jgi:hypothetical protein
VDLVAERVRTTFAKARAAFGQVRLGAGRQDRVPRTEEVAPHGTEHDRTVLAVGAAVLVGVILLGGWALYAGAVASATPAHPTSSSTDGPGGSSSAPAPAGHSRTTSTGGSASTGPNHVISVSVWPGP